MLRLLLPALAAVCLAAESAPNLLPNGDFSAGLTGWAPSEKDLASGKVSLQSEDGNGYLRLAEPTQVMAAKRLAIQPGWKKLTVRCRMRVAGLVLDESKSWGNARLANSFVMPEDKRKYLGIVQLTKDTDAKLDNGWTVLTTTAEIPAGALEFEVACGNFAKAGRAEFDDITVTAE